MTHAKRFEWVDAKPYGFLCPGCLARYGVPQADGMIDIVRCPPCRKTVAEIHQHDESIRSRRHIWRSK